MRFLGYIASSLTAFAASTVFAEGLFTQSTRFDGYKLITVPLNDKYSANFVNQHEFDVWQRNEDQMSIFVSPEQLKAIEKFGLTFDVQDVDVQALIDAEGHRLNSYSPFSNADWFSEYHRFDEALGWYDSLAEKYPNLVTINKEIGKTHEGRALWAIHLGRNDANRPAADGKQIWVQCQIHAREWISGMVCQYIAHTMLTTYEKDERVKNILDNNEIIMIPFVNPDGFAFTWEGNRLWRKNRRQDSRGIGVDLNRNYDDHWGQVGTSPNPNSDIYHGPSAGSEPETKALCNYFLANNNIVAAMDYHSFSQLILRPYGWTRNDGEHEKHLKTIADKMAKTIHDVHQKKYKSIKSTELYATSGSASDWWHGTTVHRRQQFKPYSITIELRPANSFGGAGFILPPNQIIPTGQENYAAFLDYVEYALEHPLGPSNNEDEN